MSEPDPILVLLADDHPAFRAGVHALLASDPQITVVGEAPTGNQAVNCALELQPDVVLMDLQMPDISGIEATRRIVNASPRIAVLVLTMVEDDAALFDSVRAGARGYLLKGASRDELTRAIIGVASGDAIFGSGVATRIARYFATTLPAPTDAFPQLTNREREILDLLAAGMANPAIARRLDLSAKTVRNHLSSVYVKLQVADRAQAMLKARDAGLGL